ncbi:MAG: serine hydrolase domain-containing protein [Agromyces sp.]
MTVDGLVTPGFERVAERFADFAEQQADGGLAISVMVDGEFALDLTAGTSRPGVPWTPDTLAMVFSCTKGVTALLVTHFVEAGVLSPDEPVVKWWPEFAAISSTLTVRELLEHKAGLPAVRRDMTLDEVLDHDALIAELLRQGPLWEPGTGYVYHAFTFGTLADELLRRATGSSVKELFQALIARPLGIDAWIGLPHEQEARVADIIPVGSFVEPPAEPGSWQDFNGRAMSFGTALPMPEALGEHTGFNSAKVREASLPGVNLITSARGLAQIWSAVVTPTNGVRLLTDETVRWMSQPTVTGAPLWGSEAPHIHRGFGVMLENPAITPLMSPASLGHDGFGGQAGFADPTHRASFAFVTNSFIPGMEQHKRWHQLIVDVRDALG